MRALSVTLIAALLVLGPALAGCLEDSAPGAGAGPGDDSLPSTTNTDDGLQLTVAANRSAVAPGDVVNVTFTAENVGDEAVTYRKGCFHEWDVRFLDPDGEEVQARQPTGFCLGFQKTELAPGETASAWVHWNGTLWNGERQRSEAAPAGDYTAEVTFIAFAQDSEERLNVTAGVTITVHDDNAPAENVRSGGAVRVTAEPATTILIPGAQAEVAFTATNGRAEAVDYRDGCLQSWEFRVVAPNGSDVTPAMFTCEGFQEAELAPGNSTNATYPWDGTIDGEAAPPGDYAIIGEFLFDDGGGMEKAVARATVTVTN